MPILWREEMSVGNEPIDNDHKYLVSLINAVEAAVNCGLRDKVLLTHISELLAYADEHFSREENIQAEIGFPFRDAHKREHENLTNQLHAIRVNLESHPDYKWRDSATQGLFDMLRDWLLNHILNEDLKMRDYFKRHKKTPRS